MMNSTSPHLKKRMNKTSHSSKIATWRRCWTKAAAHSYWKNPHCGLAKRTIQGCQESQTCQKEGQGNYGALGKLTVQGGQERQTYQKWKGGSYGGPSKLTIDGSNGAFGEFTVRGGFIHEVYKGENTSPKEFNDSAPRTGTGQNSKYRHKWGTCVV